LQPNDLLLSYSIQFVYKYYRIEKQDSVNVVVHSHSFYSTAAASSGQLYAAFSKVCLVPTVSKL